MHGHNVRLAERHSLIYCMRSLCVTLEPYSGHELAKQTQDIKNKKRKGVIMRQLNLQNVSDGFGDALYFVDFKLCI